MDDKRVGYFDILRIVSIFFVIVIHVTSVGLRLCETATPTWNVNWLLNSVSRWAVPVFFMVSGALFLDPRRELSIKKLYTYIQRTFRGLLFASLCGASSIPYWISISMGHYLQRVF